MKTRHALTGEIRYAIRLTQRTARLYRHVQTAGTFLAIVGGSGTLSLLAQNIPAWVGLSGGSLLAITGAALIALRPADKASQNEADTRRYLALMSKSHSLDDTQLAAALDEAHQSDCPEIEALRDVAYNDVAVEIDRPDAQVPLSRTAHFLQAIA